MKFLNGQLLLDSSLTGTTGVFTSGITSDNIFVGRKSGPIPTIGNDNIAIGVDNFSTGLTSNRAQVAIGYKAMEKLLGGYYSIAIGGYAMDNIQYPDESIAIGLDALGSATGSSHNIAIGNSSLFSDPDGFANVSIGSRAGSNINSILGGYGENTFIGYYSASNLKNSQETIAIGSAALQSNTSNLNLSSKNIAIGNAAGWNWGSGSTNIWLGYYTNGFRFGSNNVIIGGNLSESSINGSTSLSNSIILADGTGSIRLFSPSTGNILIGRTVDAGYKLDVSGTSRFSGTLRVDNPVDSYGSVAAHRLFNSSNTFLGGIGTTEWTSAGGSNTAIYSVNSIVFNTNNTNVQKVIIDTSGNVGIGVTPTSYKLEVADTGIYTTSLVSPIVDVYATYPSFRLRSASGTLYGGIGTYQWATGVGGTDTTIYSNTGLGIGFVVSGNSVASAFITSSGNFLIGTTVDAGYKLDVNGTSRFSNLLYVSRPAMTNQSNFGYQNIIVNSGFGGGYVSGTIQSMLSGFDGPSVHGVDLGYSYDGGPLGYSMWFSTNDNLTGNPIERVRIDSRGNVGIGTSQPSNRLEVSGTSLFMGVIPFSANNQTIAMVDIRPNFNRASYTGTTALALRVSGGTQIIGSGSTGTTLSVFSVDGSSGRLFDVSDDLSSTLFSVNTIAGLPVIEAFANNAVVMGKYNQNTLVVSGTSVGIGTSSPQAKLDVSGTSIFRTGVTMNGSLTLGNNDITSAWSAYTPTWTTDGTSPTLGDGTLTGYYKLIGKTCFVRVRLVFGSTTSSGTGAFYFNLPFSASSAAGIQFPCSMLDNGNAWYQAIVNGEYGGFTNKTALIVQSSGSNSSQGVSGTIPFTFANLDSIQFAGSYEIA